jgi:hypothetical protein
VDQRQPRGQGGEQPMGTLKGASYRLRNRGIDSLPSIKSQNQAD